MEHSLAPLEASVRPWRTATLVASAVAAVELIVILVAGVALLGKPLSREARDAAVARALAPKLPNEAPKVGAAATPKLARGETSVIVLNGNGRTGAAAMAAETVRARGYLVGTVGNAPRSDYGRSIVMYRRPYKAEAIRLARDLRVKRVGPLDGLRTRDLMGAHVAYIVGN